MSNGTLDASWSCLEIVDNGSLTSIDFSGLSSLKDLTIDRNRNLTSLDLSGLSSLKDLDIHGTDVTSLDLSDLSSLEDLFMVANNALTSLDLSDLSSLKDLLIIYNEALTSLDLSVLSSLEDLYIAQNDALTSLDLSVLSSLKDLYISKNGALISLDLSDLSSLKNLYIGYNDALTTIDISSLSFTRALWVTNNPLLTTLTYSGTCANSLYSDEPDLEGLPRCDSASPAPKPSVIISETSLEIPKGGGSAEYTVNLSSRPSGDVIITPSSDSEIIKIETKELYFRGVSEPLITWREQGSLTFTQDNWDTSIRVSTNSIVADGDYIITHNVSSTDYQDISAPEVKIKVSSDLSTMGLRNVLKEINQALACEVIEAIELRTLQSQYCQSINRATFEKEIDRLTFNHKEILRERRVLEVRDIEDDFNIQGLNKIIPFMPRLLRIHIMGNHKLSQIDLDLSNLKGGRLSSLFINKNDSLEQIKINSIKTQNLVISRFYVRKDYEDQNTTPGDPASNTVRFCSPSSTRYKFDLLRLQRRTSLTPFKDGWGYKCRLPSVRLFPTARHLELGSAFATLDNSANESYAERGHGHDILREIFLGEQASVENLSIGRAPEITEIDLQEAQPITNLTINTHAQSDGNKSFSQDMYDTPSEAVIEFFNKYYSQLDGLAMRLSLDEHMLYWPPESKNYEKIIYFNRKQSIKNLAIPLVQSFVIDDRDLFIESAVKHILTFPSLRYLQELGYIENDSNHITLRNALLVRQALGTGEIKGYRQEKMKVP